MNLYEIDSQISGLIDPETGEVMDIEAFEQLEMERNQKIENIACWIKNLKSDAAELKAEEKSLAERRDAKESKADRLTAYLVQILNGSKFESARCKVGFRKSTRLQIEDETEFVRYCDPAFLIQQPPKIDKAAIKEAIKGGSAVDGAEIIEANNIQIK
jgi:FtsZ-binding cell division protein ZapB